MTTKRKRETPKGPGDNDTDGLQKFQRAVQELKTKSQSKITGLTQLADTLSEFASEVTFVLAEEISHAQMSRLQPLISVVDSILKKVGKDYKGHLSLRMPDILRGAARKSDGNVLGWLQKMVRESWRKHDLLPTPVLDVLDSILAEPLAGEVTAAAPPAPSPVAAAGAVDPRLQAPEFSAQAVAVPQTAAVPVIASQPPPAPPPVTLEAPPYVPVPPVQSSPRAEERQPPDKLLKAGPAPPMKAPPPPMKAAPAAESKLPSEPAIAKPKASAVAKQAPAASAQLQDSPALVERRLTILSKIIERRSPEHEELHEIMKVPEIRKAIAMQQKGERQQAMALLSQFKQELERKHNEYLDKQASKEPAPGAAEPDQRPTDPRQLDARPPDPRQPDPRQTEVAKPMDPRQQLDSSVAKQQLAAVGARPADPRQPQQPMDPRPVDPRQLERQKSDLQPPDPRQSVLESVDSSSGKRSPEAQLTELRQKQQKLQVEQTPLETISEDEPEGLSEQLPNGQGIATPRHVLQGLPSIGFSEAWLRQFLEQLPTRGPSQETRPPDVPSVGRKVLGASGEQMVYVDELSPSEVLLLMQFIFLLEERLRRTGGGVDLTQRIPHTFSYLQVEPAIDVMLKRFFDELPFQCTTTGLRFSSREKLRKHHDALYRRRTLLQQRQRGAEARGWMESIPEWVGNRDLVVGPALFRLGGVGDDATMKGQEALRSLQEASSELEDEPGESRWICPMDERRSVCPISGEAFKKIWSTVLNDWAYEDVVVVELGAADQPLRFPLKGASAANGLSETAVVFKKPCFFNTPLAKRLQSLEECRSTHCPQSSPEVKKPTPREDPELAALAAPRPKPAKFF